MSFGRVIHEAIVPTARRLAEGRSRGPGGKPDVLARALDLAEASALGFEPSLFLRWNRSVEPSRDVPAERPTQSAALADALRRTAAASAGWIVEALDESHD